MPTCNGKCDQAYLPLGLNTETKVWLFDRRIFSYTVSSFKTIHSQHNEEHYFLSVKDF